MEPRECESCGEEIPAKRVQALPRVRFCVNCQQQEEKAGNHKRHTMEIYQGLEGWQLEEVKTILIRGDD